MIRFLASGTTRLEMVQVVADDDEFVSIQTNGSLVKQRKHNGGWYGYFDTLDEAKAFNRAKLERMLHQKQDEVDRVQALIDGMMAITEEDLES